MIHRPPGANTDTAQRVTTVVTGGAGVMTVEPAVDHDTHTDLLEHVALDTPWQVVVWDDPVNLMSWVTWVFRTYFGFSLGKAQSLMLEVHTKGRAVVFSGTLEQAEQHVTALHGYGLWATYERSGGSSGGGGA